MTKQLLDIKTIQEHASINYDPSTKVIPENLKFGQFIAQGDLNLYYLGNDMENIPFEKLSITEIKNPTNEDLQLAEGNTKGSRHILSSFKNVRIYKLNNPNAIQSRILEFSGSETLTHPEHGDQVYRKGVYLVTYQVLRSEDLARIQD